MVAPAAELEPTTLQRSGGCRQRASGPVPLRRRERRAKRAALKDVRLHSPLCCSVLLRPDAPIFRKGVYQDLRDSPGEGSGWRRARSNGPVASHRPGGARDGEGVGLAEVATALA